MASHSDSTSYTFTRCLLRSRDRSTPGDIVFPKDSDGRELGPSSPFFTVFYPGTNDPSRALTVFPEAGTVIENINFAVRQRSGYGIHSVDTYAYPGQMAVKPPYLSPNIQYPFIVAAGSGLFSGNSLAQGLSVRVLGGATLSVRPYSPAPSSYAQIDFDVRTLSFSADSPRHLVFSQNGDIYVLPAAFFHVEKLPPSISSVIPVTDGSQRLAAISRIESKRSVPRFLRRCTRGSSRVRCARRQTDCGASRRSGKPSCVRCHPEPGRAEFAIPAG